MNADTFCEHFATFAEAPNGVEKLRELILQLAVQGKLVPQDENDEPASVLIERARKASLDTRSDTKSKRVQTAAKMCLSEDLPECPTGWAWATLGEMGVASPRNDLPDDTEVSFLPMASISTEYRGPLEPETRKWGEVKQGFTHVADGDVAMAKITPCFQNGKTTVIRGLLNGRGAGTTELHVLRPYPDCLIPEYAVIFLRSPQFVAQGVARMSGSAGQQRVPKEHFAGSPFPLPPLEEQRRIVAKVDQLLALSDELAARQAARREARERLVGATLDRLVSVRSAAESPAHAHRLRDHFDRLFDTPITIPQLRQAILQLAVQGQLVPQDPNDERVSMSLACVRVLRQKLLAAKQIKSIEFAPITDDEIEHRIPGTWAWSRLGEICKLITDGTHLTPNYTAAGRIFLSAQNVKPFCFQPDNHRFVSEDDYQVYIKSKKAEFEDVLLTRVGAGIGEAAVINQHLDFAFYVSVGLLRPFRECLDPYFLAVWLNSPIGRNHSQRKTYGKGVSQGNLNLNLIRAFILPIPPLAEQKRIVSKVTELLSLCDALEAKLMQAESASDQLLSAAIHNLLNGDEVIN